MRLSHRSAPAIHSHKHLGGFLLIYHKSECIINIYRLPARARAERYKQKGRTLLPRSSKFPGAFPRIHLHKPIFYSSEGQLKNPANNSVKQRLKGKDAQGQSFSKASKSSGRGICV